MKKVWIVPILLGFLSCNGVNSDSTARDNGKNSFPVRSGSKSTVIEINSDVGNYVILNRDKNDGASAVVEKTDHNADNSISAAGDKIVSKNR